MEMVSGKGAGVKRKRSERKNQKESNKGRKSEERVKRRGSLGKGRTEKGKLWSKGERPLTLRVGLLLGCLLWPIFLLGTSNAVPPL